MSVASVPGAITLVASLLLSSALAAQDHAGHGSHEMEEGWVMPPMDPNMPMPPGLEGVVPVTGPWVPTDHLDPAGFSVARPSRIVEMADGDTLDLLVAPVRRTIRGREYLMYGYNDQYPGPLIRTTRGAKVVVRVRNEILQETTVHWHGVRLENRFDGVPGLTQPPIEPGETFVYEVDVPDEGMFWYHPHLREDVQQDLGLYGNLWVTPSEAGAYGPVHREEVVALDDLLVSDDGRLVPWGEEDVTHALMGRFGNVLLANGRTDYSLDLERGEVVRYYLTNVANSRSFNVRFHGARVKLVGSDVGRFEAEQWLESVIISPGERYVVDVRYAEAGAYAITNTIQAVNHFRGEFYPHVDTLGLVRVSEQPVASDLASEFQELRRNPDVQREIDPFREHFEGPPDRELVTTLRARGLPTPIVLSMEADTFYVPPMEWNDAMPMMNWLSTGRQVTWVLRDRETGAENHEIDWTFREGDVVKIRIFNDPDSFHPMNHPIHIHGQRFLVVARDGIPQRTLAWKDTAILPVGSTMDLLVEMSNPGDWMLHCHIAEHLEAGMHFPFSVRETSQVDRGKEAERRRSPSG